MLALLLWFVLGLLTAAFTAFIASHYRYATLRVQAAGWLGGYTAAFLALALVPDASRLRFLGPLAWLFSHRVPLAAAWHPLLSAYAAFGLVIWYFVPRYERIGLGDPQGTLRHLVFPFRAAALTFDDGPSPEWTPRILEVLRRHQVKATFFMVGESVEKHPDLVRQVAAAGHSIGSHSWSHRCMPLLDARTLPREIDRAAGAFEKALGRRPQLFRPPWGAYNRRVLDELRARGCLTVLWSRSSRDWSNPGVDEIVRRASENPELGEIILFHDGGNYPARSDDPDALKTSRQQTVEALDQLIPALERQGFQLKTLDEMIQAWLS